MQPISLIPKSIEEEKLKFISICNRCEFLMELKEIKKSLYLVVKEEVSLTAEILEKMEPSLEKSKGVVHDKHAEGLLPMRGIQHHDVSILQKKSTRCERFQFFKFISPTISIWARCVLHGMPSFISNCTLKDLLLGDKSMKCESMMYMYG